MNLSKGLSVFIFLSLLMLTASVSWGQTGTTSLHGVVVDSSGATVADARVSLQNPTQAFERKTRP